MASSPKNTSPPLPHTKRNAETDPFNLTALSLRTTQAVANTSSGGATHAHSPHDENLSSRESAAHVSTSQPTATLKEIEQDLANYSTAKLHLALHKVYPVERPYVQDFRQLISEITTLLIKGSAEEMKQVNPEDVVIYLVDKPSINAYVTPTSRKTFPIFIHRGLIEEFLSAPEFKDKNLCTDALAGVVAHEICHVSFQRNYGSRVNSMLQEEYCDILPARMLERVGFRPEALSALCDVVARVNQERGATKITRDEPHASFPIRKEVFEKGAWKEYERERRKEHLASKTSVDSLRTAWHAQIQSIADATKDHRIISFIAHELQQRNFEHLPPEERLEVINSILKENSELFNSRHREEPLKELSDAVIQTLRQAGPAASTFAQHDCLVNLSKMLYQGGRCEMASAYNSIARALNTPNFGAFMDLDDAYTAFLRATSKEDARAALAMVDKAWRYGIRPGASNETWGHIIFPNFHECMNNIFSAADFTSLTEGGTIPFPFAPHRELEAELRKELREDSSGDSSRAHDTFRTLWQFAGIGAVCRSLLQTDDDFDRSSWKLASSLLKGTKCSALEGFEISMDSGIRMLYPSRLACGPEGATESLLQSEREYAKFLAKRGQPLTSEVASLTHSNFFTFAKTYGHLIMPQAHPVRALSADLTRDSHQLADAMMARLSQLMREEPTPKFRQEAKDFLCTFTPMIWSGAWQVYAGYHDSIAEHLTGARVDPTHPLVRAVLENFEGLLSHSEQLTSISSLNYFEGTYFSSLKGEELRRAFSQAVGGEKRLIALFQADPSLPPDRFVASLTRLGGVGSRVYDAGRDEMRTHTPIREIRAQLIQEYLERATQPQCTLEHLHTLQDLCMGGVGRSTSRHITALATNLALREGFVHLSNDDFCASYQHLVCMGATDQSVGLEAACNDEIIRRYKALPTNENRLSFLNELLYPKPFSCGDKNSLVSFINDFTKEQLSLFKTIEHVSSVYIPRTTEPNFERFVIEAAIEANASAIRAATKRQHDDRSPQFLAECTAMLARFDQQKLPISLRARILQGVADELLLQRESAFLFRDNLNLHSRYQSRLTFADCMTATHQYGTLTNVAAAEVHNGLIELRASHEKPLRESLLRFFLDRNPKDELTKLTKLLTDKLMRRTSISDEHAPIVFRTLGMVGISVSSDAESRTQQEQLIEHHLRGLHQRFSELDVKAKGATLSTLAVDNAPTEESFKTFKEDFLLPRVLPKKGPYNDLLLSAINDYFDFYSNALHHKYMVACAILAASQDPSRKTSGLTQVGLVAKSFLGGHGTAGYKLLQRIRNHPSTPQEVKGVLHDVLDQTISLPRWTIHERIEEFGPQGATQHWIGKAKAGSMCLSVPLKKEDGSETFLSIIHPGAHIDSLYWLQNFTTMASHLAEQDSRLGVLAPMAQQTRHLIQNETDFKSSPEPQQKTAERAYTYTMNFPHDSITVTSSCAPLISSESKPHRTDFMLNSGNKEAGCVMGSTLLEMVSEFKEKAATGEWTKAETQKRFIQLQVVTFSILANEVCLIASCQGKDHDRHPGNYLVEVEEDETTGHTTIHINHFDFGCTDITDPSDNVRKELGTTLQRFAERTSVLTGLFSPRRVTDQLTLALFEKGTFVPEIASIPLGLLAATGANERVRINGRQRTLLSGGELLRAVKVGLESAKVPTELGRAVPTGFKGWLLRKAYERIDTRGITFEA